jgi:hypothetical protein
MDGEILRVWECGRPRGPKPKGTMLWRSLACSLAFPWKGRRKCSTCLVQGPGAGRYAMGRASGAGCCTHARTAAQTDSFFLGGSRSRGRNKGTCGLGRRGGGGHRMQSVGSSAGRHGPAVPARCSLSAWTSRQPRRAHQTGGVPRLRQGARFVLSPKQDTATTESNTHVVMYMHGSIKQKLISLHSEK